MKKIFNKHLYIVQFILGLFSSFIGNKLVSSPRSTLYMNSYLHGQDAMLFLHLANHQIAGIFLGFVGFILLAYLLFITALQLLYHWHHLQSLIRIAVILWSILLLISTFYHAVTLYHILGYIFVLAAVVFSLLLILNYLHHEI
ncbi:hypothetical protein QBE52_06790 [Clostridiaceae bacterium 35-E11]